MQTTCIPRPIPPRSPLALRLQQRAQSCLRWTRDVFAHWQRARSTAENRRALRTLDDPTLKDIGLDRSEIESWLACGEAGRRAR